MDSQVNTASLDHDVQCAIEAGSVGGAQHALHSHGCPPGVFLLKRWRSRSCCWLSAKSLCQLCQARHNVDKRGAVSGLLGPALPAGQGRQQQAKGRQTTALEGAIA